GSTSKTPSYTKSVSWQHHPFYHDIKSRFFTRDLHKPHPARTRRKVYNQYVTQITKTLFYFH
ncbi:hypothetical protein, partial [Enterobacter kobei]|uniref:hypothetical protein n=1 Tax=Enterobacter kobei TaxID=208224 RepID=UPI0039C369EF